MTTQEANLNILQAEALLVETACEQVRKSPDDLDIIIRSALRSTARLAQKQTARLAKELLDLNGVPSCTYLHHKSSHRHGDDTECLAEKRYNEISATIRLLRDAKSL